MKKCAGIIGLVLIDAYFLKCAFSYADWHFIDGVDLIFHEAGHAIFSFFGEFVRVAMGSGFQALVPLLISIYFFSTGQRTSASIVLAWFGQSLLNVSVYANDAIDMRLPLLGGDGAFHDWNYLLTATGYITYAHEVARAIYITGMIAIFAGVALSIWFYGKDRFKRE